MLWLFWEKVKKRKQDEYGNPIGYKKSNTILDTRNYELEIPDICIEQFAVNILSDNLFNRADSDVWETGLIDEVIVTQNII